MKKILALAVAFVCLPALLGQVSHWFSTVMTDSAYTWLDEAYSTESAMSYFEHGYRGYRCREDNANYCYGGGQALLDGFILRHVAKEQLAASATIQSPGARWPWLLHYPKMGQVLRAVRMVSALGILFLLGFAALGGGGAFAVGIVLALSMTPTFQASWQMIKNDHYSAFFGLIYLFFLAPSLRAGEHRRRFGLFVVASLIGMFAVNVRPGFVIPYAFGIAAFFLGEGIRRVPLKVLFKEAAFIFASNLALYLALNPNTFVSGFEAKWITGFFTYNKNPERFKANFRLEIKSLIQNLWIFGFLVAAVVVFARERGLKETALRWGYFLVTPAFFSWLVVRAALLRPHYYLPATLVAFVGFVLVLRELREYRRGLVAVFLCTVIGARLLSAPHVLASWKELYFPAITQAPSLDVLVNRDPATRGTHWLADDMLRVPFRTSRVQPEQVRYFDSLSDPPAKVLADAKDDEVMLVSCWLRRSDPRPKKGERAKLASVHSPVTEQWATLTRSFCKEAEPASNWIFQIMTIAYRTEAYASIPVPELKRELSRLHGKPPLLEERKLDIRQLQGGPFLIEHFEFPRFTRKSIALHGEFLAAYPISSISVPTQTSYRNDGTVALSVHVHGDAKSADSGPISVNTTDKFCADYPRLCYWKWFRNWSMRYYPTERPLVASVKIPAGTRFDVDIRVELPKEENGMVVFRDVEFNSARKR
jgi:hypothetical protein